MLKKLFLRKNLLMNKIEKNKKIDEEKKIKIENNINDILNYIIENISKNNEKTSAIIIDNLNKDLDKVEIELEEE